MRITLKQAHKLLEDCTAVIVEDNKLVRPSMAELNGNEENEFMCLRWSDSLGQEYAETFLEGPNNKIELHGSSLFPVGDCNGDQMQVTLLFTNNLETRI